MKKNCYFFPEVTFLVFLLVEWPLFHGIINLRLPKCRLFCAYFEICSNGKFMLAHQLFHCCWLALFSVLTLQVKIRSQITEPNDGWRTQTNDVFELLSVQRELDLYLSPRTYCTQWGRMPNCLEYTQCSREAIIENKKSLFNYTTIIPLRELVCINFKWT